MSRRSTEIVTTRRKQICWDSLWQGSLTLRSLTLMSRNSSSIETKIHYTPFAVFAKRTNLKKLSQNLYLANFFCEKICANLLSRRFSQYLLRKTKYFAKVVWHERKLRTQEWVYSQARKIASQEAQSHRYQWLKELSYYGRQRAVRPCTVIETAERWVPSSIRFLAPETLVKPTWPIKQFRKFPFFFKEATTNIFLKWHLSIGRS
jgi:hypothetical protein